ncbi:AAA family ATPase [uncultured Martelella sp.]|uniref:ATP-binding protein n=1 Tax=uncultured Martelella sp. TaxID=392331 RepID=UPI0029C81519|nr:AAA family ATPase [uncultured Martelella sp.]
MRFLTLDLIRYGHFTEREIAFRPDAALHIVYGPNEAGKSSALSAFSDLLFGFPDRDVGFDFLHDARDLRVGAEIRARGGETLAFRRRKGRKNTLLAAGKEGDSALNDDALSGFLGSLDRTVFERAFGLDSERLRAGAAEMLADGGEIGQILFSAASGLTGLRSVGEALAADADRIYAPRKSQNRSFYQALERHDAARKAERALELNASDWKALLREESEIEAELAALGERQHARRTRMADLDRLQRLRGLLAEVDRHERALAQFADLEAVSEETGAELEKLQQREARMAGEVEDKAGRLVVLRRDFEALKIDHALLARREEVRRLYAESGIYAQALEHLPEREAAFQEVMSALSLLASDLGFSEIENLEKNRPDNILLSDFKALMEEGRKRESELAALEKGLAENRRAVEALESEDGGGQLVDPAPLRRRFDALRPELVKLEDADALEAEIAARERALCEDAAALRPAVADIHGLSRGALPDIAAVRAAGDQIAATQQALETLDRKIAEGAAERDRIEAQMAQEAGDGAVLTRQDIAAVRQERDRVFEVFVAGNGTRETYLASVVAADGLADRALDNAEKVARHGEYLKRLDALQREADERARERQELTGTLAEETEDFRALFQPSAVEASGPEHMLDWLRQVAQLFERREALYGLIDRRKGLEKLKAALGTGLAELAGDVGIDMLVLPLARYVEARIERLSERWEDARRQQAEISAARQAIARREQELAALKTAGEDFAGRYARCLAAVGLDEGTGLAAAETALQLWGRVPSLVERKDRLGREISADRERIERFDAAAAALVSDLAPDLAGRLAADVVQILGERIDRNTSEAARRNTLKEAADTLAGETQALKDDLDACRAELAEIAQSLPDGVSADGLAARLSERAAIRRELAEARRRFLEGSEGADEAETRALAEGLDVIACRQEREALAAEEAEDETVREDLLQRRAACRHRKQELGRGESAEQAAFDRVSAEEEARELAREWVVLKLAGNLLDAAMERYRAGRADPILDNAARHFAALTMGGFDGLLQNYGANDELLLVARRADGGEVPVEGLSDGTRDQLYLALRLAFLEDYASRNEPAPLIVDDIFQTFDDARSASGLKALSALGGDIQTILFTHEKSLVDIARNELGDKADIVMLER